MNTDRQMDVAADVRSLSGALGSTLGPYGARKLLLEESGTVTVTSSCSTLLDRLDVDNPAVTVFDRAASGFEATHGDGITRLVVLTGALIRAAERLSEQGVHPTAIERGFREACSVATDRLTELERPLSVGGADAVAHAALTDVRDQSTRQRFAALLGDVVDELDAAGVEFDSRNFAVSTRIGAGQAESELVHGVVLDRPPAVEEMPRSPGTVGVAALSETVDVPNFGGPTARTGNRYSLESTTLEDKRAFADRERAAFDDQLASVLEAGCRVVVTQKAINERVKALLATHGILALERVQDEDFRRVVDATGATAVPGLAEVSTDTLGRATVNVVREAGRDMTVIESTRAESVYTLYCRSPEHRSLDALRDSMEAAIASVDDARTSGTVVPGGGATEMAVSRTLNRHAPSVTGIEQLAVDEFGRALTAIPRRLAGTTGLDATTALVELRRAHSEGRDAVGVDSVTGDIVDVLTASERPIVDPASLTREIWSAATDLAIRFVRVDDVLSATDLADSISEGSQGGPGLPSRP